MTVQNPFPQPTRQSFFAIIFILGNVFRRLFRQLWPVILILLFNPKKTHSVNSFTVFFIGLAIFGAIMSIFNFLNYFFYISDGELRMEKGVFRKVKVNVPLNRIQTVNFRQDLFHQIFNVVAIEIDTAGSADKEFSLDAISKDKAEALRNFIENARQTDGQAAEGIPSGELVGEDGPIRAAVGSPPAREQLLFHLSSLDLIKVGVSQNHLRTAGIIMAFFMGFADDLENALGLNISEKTEEWLGTAKELDLLYYLVLGLPFFLLVSFLVTLVRTALQHFNLKFWRTERGFKIVSGLFTRQEVSANLRKIQFVRWSSSPLMRVFGMVAVRMPQAASVEMTRKLAVGLPGCYQPQLDAVREAYFPGEKNLEYEEHGVNERIIRRQFLLQGILPVALLVLLTYSLLGASVWIWGLWLPPALWLCIRLHRTWLWKVSEESIQAHWGVITRTSVVLQWYKVQAVTIRQSIFLRSSGLAHMVLHTAAGNLSLPYIPIEKARAMQDFVLYKIETDNRKWM